MKAKGVAEDFDTPYQPKSTAEIAYQQLQASCCTSLLAAAKLLAVLSFLPCPLALVEVLSHGAACLYV